MTFKDAIITKKPPRRLKSIHKNAQPGSTKAFSAANMIESKPYSVTFSYIS